MEANVIPVVEKKGPASETWRYLFKVMGNTRQNQLDPSLQVNCVHLKLPGEGWLRSLQKGRPAEALWLAGTPEAGVFLSQNLLGLRKHMVSQSEPESSSPAGSKLPVDLFLFGLGPGRRPY